MFDIGLRFVFPTSIIFFENFFIGLIGMFRGTNCHIIIPISSLFPILITLTGEIKGILIQLMTGIWSYNFFNLTTLRTCKKTPKRTQCCYWHNCWCIYETQEIVYTFSINNFFNGILKNKVNSNKWIDITKLFIIFVQVEIFISTWIPILCLSSECNENWK